MKMLPKECSKCLKENGNICIAFNDPYFQWKNGRRCYGYTDNPAEMLKMYQEMYEYNLLKNEDSESIKRIIAYYQEMLNV
jgi:hypothetical protein